MRTKHVLTNLAILVFLFGNLYGSISPNPLISVGKTVFASPDADKQKLVNGIWNDGWGSNWVSDNGSWLAIEVGSGPEAVMLNFNNYHYSWCSTLLSFCDDQDPDYIGEYHIYTSANSTDGENGDWEEVVHVTGNTFSARTHSFDFIGKSWVKMEIVSAHVSEQFLQYGLTDPSIGEIEIFDISDGQDDSWFFIGNSITAGALKGLAYSEGEMFEEIIEEGTEGSYRPMVLRGGVPCIHSYEVADVLDHYYNVGGSEAKYWAILLGTNDAWGSSNSGVDTYKTNMQIIIDYALDNDKVPILAQIPATGESDAGWQVHPDYLTAIEELISENDLLEGPDFYSYYLDHQNEIDNDGVHLTDAGGKSMQRLWAEFALEEIYGGDKPSISNFIIDPNTIINESATEIDFSATITDDIGTVETVSLDLSAIGGGAEVTMVKSGDEYSYTYELAAGASAGIKSISVTAINSSANSRIKTSSIEIIDPALVAPEISNFLVTPSSANSESDTQIEFSATVSDVLGTVSSVSLDLSSLGGGEEVLMNKNGDEYTYSYTISAPQEIGSKSIIINASSAGGQNNSETIALLIKESVEGGLTIYNDSESRITSTWVANGRGSVNEVSGGAFEGSSHYLWDYIVSGWYGNIGLVLDNSNGVDFSGYESLKLACKMSGSANATIRLLDTDDNASETSELSGISTDYGYIEIPVSNFNTADLTSIQQIVIDLGGNMDSETGTFNFDDIFLISGEPKQINNFTADPATVYDNTTTEIEFSANITPASGSSIVSATLDLSSIGGSSAYVMTASGNVYTANYTAPSGLNPGIETIQLKLETDQGEETEIVQITVVHVKPIPENALIIYNDNETLITGHWENSFTLTEVSDQAYEGTKNWRFECSITEGWANFAFNLNNWSGPGIDFSVYEYIQFACRYSGASTVSIGLQPQGGNVESVELDGLNSDYQVFTIPLDQFAGINLDDIYEIRLNYWGVQTEYGVFDIDDIKLIPEGGGLYTPELAIPESTVTIAWEEGSAAYFDIESNVSWNVSTDASWLTIVNPQGTGNGSVAVVAQENTASSIRSTNILIDGVNVDDATITAIQNAEGTLSIETGNRLEAVVYPNPASSEFRIHSSVPVSVTVFNMQGLLVKYEQNIQDKTIDISDMKDGLYFVKIESGEGVELIKLIKH